MADSHNRKFPESIQIQKNKRHFELVSLKSKCVSLFFFLFKLEKKKNTEDASGFCYVPSTLFHRVFCKHFSWNFKFQRLIDKQISWVITGKKRKKKNIKITITIITKTVITRNVSNKHSPVQSGSFSDWPQPNWSISLQKSDRLILIEEK